ASVCLTVDHTEDSTTFLSMISRILQLLLIDILSVGISLDAQNSRLVVEHKTGDSAENRRLLISHLDG
ncbi:MAG TPA: bifunctional transcriptional regulator/glucokinase, partial [Duganella sp.]|nr:bifunctional transcriptional regulator/glucokinase [Duganella sp.]